MHSITQAFRADPEDVTRFRIGRFNTGEAFCCMTVGDVDLYLEVDQLAALRVATGQALLDMHAQAPTHTADEDDDSEVDAA